MIRNKLQIISADKKKIKLKQKVTVEEKNVKTIDFPILFAINCKKYDKFNKTKRLFAKTLVSKR